MDSLIKNKILSNENDRVKLQEEIDAKAAEHGLRAVVPMQGQDEYQVLSDIENNGNKFEEEMRKKEQADAALRTIRRQQSQPTHQMTEEAYYRMKEAREKAEYEARKIRL